MPTIKNGQYSDILLRKEHLFSEEDVILYRKYYRYDEDDDIFTVYKGLRYYLTRSNHPLFFYESNGYVGGDETLSYQIENRKLPLLWKHGRWEIRMKNSRLMTIDCRAGWVIEAWLEGGIVKYSEKVILSNIVKSTVEKYLRSYASPFL